MSKSEGRKPNFRSPGGEVLVVDFITPEHWAEAKADLDAAGIDFDRFIGKKGSVYPVRNARYDSTSSERWQGAVSRLWGDVQEVRSMLDETRRRSVRFGLAIPSPLYEPPVSRVTEGGGLSTTFGRYDEYEFMGDETTLRDRHYPLTLMNSPELAVQSLSVVLQYREAL